MGGVAEGIRYPPGSKVTLLCAINTEALRPVTPAPEAIEEQFTAKVKEYVLQFYSAEPQRTEFFGRLPNKTSFGRVAHLIKKDEAFLVHPQGGRRFR